MARIKYAGEAAVSRIADYVNKKLAFASSMPVSPEENVPILYIGNTTNDFTQGGIYVYDGTDWILINVASVELTLAEYQTLPKATQENGTIYFITDAGGSGGEGSIVEGYYNTADGKFYEEDTYTTEIHGSDGDIYIALDTNMLYRYDAVNTEFVQIAGSGSGAAIKYVSTLPTTNIEDIIYAMTTHNSATAEVAADFLDDNELFVRTDNGDNYTYTAADGKEIEASEDDTTYLGFTSLAYDNTSSEWTLTFLDGTNATLADGDTFYYREVILSFFAGDSEEQITVPFGSAGGGGGAYYSGSGINIDSHVISVKPATSSSIGGVIPDNTTLEVDGAGVISGKYEGGYGIKVDGNEISSKVFVGTQADWDALTTAQKAEYDTVSITDDASALNNTPGHEIVDSSGTALPQRSKLKINGATITDDSTNDTTILSVDEYTEGRGIDIDTNKEISVDEKIRTTFIGTKAQWEALNNTQKAEYELVNLTDDPCGSGTVVVDVVADGNMNAVTSNATYNAIQNLIIKINNYSVTNPTDPIWTTAYNTSISKSGLVVNISVGGITNSAVSVVPNSTIICKIPAGYRPLVNVMIDGVYATTASGTKTPTTYMVKTNGDVVYAGGSSTMSLAYFMIKGAYGVGLQ